MTVERCVGTRRRRQAQRATQSVLCRVVNEWMVDIFTITHTYEYHAVSRVFTAYRAHVQMSEAVESR
jgi:hypothetical protein